MALEWREVIISVFPTWLLFPNRGQAAGPFRLKKSPAGLAGDLSHHP